VNQQDCEKDKVAVGYERVVEGRYGPGQGSTQFKQIVQVSCTSPETTGQQDTLFCVSFVIDIESMDGEGLVPPNQTLARGLSEQLPLSV